MSFADPQYRVQCHQFLNNTAFGIGSLIVEFSELKNVGWGKYLNDVPEAFFTINQDDPQLAYIRQYIGKCHMRIERKAGAGAWDIVWSGWLMEADSRGRDVVFYGYGYLSGLWWLHSDWNTEWTSSQINTIVGDLWTRAKDTLTQSNVKFVTTGTIEAPVTTSGGATPIVLPAYTVYYKRILLIFQELAALAASDTSNGVVFEITDGTTPTFNFWKNRGSDISTEVWEWDGAVADFRQLLLPVVHRNHILAVGTPATSAIYRYETSDAGDINDYGRRQESIFLQWVRDQTELERVAKRRLSMALREDIYLELTFAKGRVIPPGTSASTWGLADRVRIKIDRGVTSIDEYRLVTGVQVLSVRGAEYVRAITQQRPGA